MKRRKKKKTISATSSVQRPTAPPPSFAVLLQEYENARGKMGFWVPEDLLSEGETDPFDLPTVIPPAPTASEVRLLGAVSEQVSADLEHDPRAERIAG